MIDSEIMVGTGLRISVAKDELTARLQTVSRGVSTRTAVLVLGGIQLRAEGDQLHLAATDMEVSLRASLDAQVAAGGLEQDPAEDLHGRAGRHRARHDAERLDELVLRSGYAQPCAHHVFCLNHLLISL
jgi:hypothetical protein